MTRANPKNNSRRGYTLLELLLSLTLSVVIIGAIGVAIQLYLIALSRQQALIERKQIARSVTQMISSDLRAGVQYKAADYSGLENLVKTQMLTANNPQPTEEGEEEMSEEMSDEEAMPVVDEEAVSSRPSLVGGPNSITIDISRLPRLDQYNPLIADNNGGMQTKSDVKTLAYFFSNANPTNQNGVQFSPTAAPGGLYRRTIDRAVAKFNGDSGLTSTPDEYCELVANEVAEIQFRFFDGQTWLTDWDSEENGGFPPAVEVTIVIDPRRMSGGRNYAYGGFDRQVMELYRGVVHLPGAEVIEEEEE
jgi:type II secretory pathway pseudopilin PulG